MSNTVKMLFDRGAAFMGLLLLSPVMLFIAGLIRLKMGGPVLFRQTRPGLKGRPFVMVKFRTMLQDQNLPENERVTALGRFLRSSSLDELPELWNVLKGEMSLVGPRPLLMEYLPRYSEEQMRRHDVLPGITGHAQVNGRNTLHWDERFKLDVWYVDHHSFSLDLYILFRTFKKVVVRDGINSSADKSMEEFLGPKKDVA